MTSRFLALFAAFGLISVSAQAAPASGNDTEYLTGTLGWYDATQQDNEATLFGAEYRFAPVYYGLRPIAGGFYTTDQSAYGYAGLQYDLALIPEKLYLSPNFAAGAYTAGDDGKRLGGAIEFRSGIELGYQFANKQRLGAAFNHMSNASIYNHNPGVETILVTYSVPTGRNFY